MKFLAFILIFLSHSTPAWADKKLCEIYEWMACPDAFSASRSTTSASLPLNSSAGASNPASMTTDRGFGLEAIKFKNWYDVNVISGTGVIGSALSISNGEGTFFGAVPMERDDEYVHRVKENRKYKSQKMTGIFAFSLLGDSKKKKRKFNVNAGLIGKYNGESKNWKGGGGLTMSLWFLSVGAARYGDDDMVVDNTVEHYYTNTFTTGLKLGNLAFDWTWMKNDARLWSRARFLTATLFTKTGMFTFGSRSEQTPTPRLIEDHNKATESDSTKNYLFYGMQAVIKKKFVVGLFYNYYLTNEISFGFSFFI